MRIKLTSSVALQMNWEEIQSLEEALKRPSMNTSAAHERNLGNTIKQLEKMRHIAGVIQDMKQDLGQDEE